MKLAEALMERKAIKTTMEDLKKRIYQNSSKPEGEQAIEDPLDLIEVLRAETEKFEKLIVRINQTNNVTFVSEGMTLMEAIIKKDMLKYLQLIHNNLADKAMPTHQRFSRREIKFVPTINITDIRNKANRIAQEYRLLDMKIQEANWHTELI